MSEFERMLEHTNKPKTNEATINLMSSVQKLVDEHNFDGVLECLQIIARHNAEHPENYINPDVVEKWQMWADKLMDVYDEINGVGDDAYESKITEESNVSEGVDELFNQVQSQLEKLGNEPLINLYNKYFPQPEVNTIFDKLIDLIRRDDAALLALAKELGIESKN